MPRLYPEYNGKRINDDSKAQTGVYLIINGKRRGMPGDPDGKIDTYNNLFPDRNGIEGILDVTDITDGGDLSLGAMLVSDPIDGVCLITDGMKWPIADEATMDAYYFDRSKVVAMPKVVLDGIPWGPEININTQ